MDSTSRKPGKQWAKKEGGGGVCRRGRRRWSAEGQRGRGGRVLVVKRCGAEAEKCTVTLIGDCPPMPVSRPRP